MNVEKLYEALDEGRMNSALGTLCAELENQGYSVAIGGRKVSSEELVDGKHEDLEQGFAPIKIALYRGKLLEQEFAVQFTEYHEFIIKKKSTASDIGL